MAKKKNIFQRYFENFGLKQICDILMVISFILLIVGWIIWKSTIIVLEISLGLFILTSLLGIIRNLMIIRGEQNKRSPERRAAVVNLICVCCIFAVAVFGMIYGLTAGFVIPAIG